MLIDEMKIEMVKSAIKTPEGWSALAKTVHNQPEAGLVACSTWFKVIAGDDEPMYWDLLRQLSTKALEIEEINKSI